MTTSKLGVEYLRESASGRSRAMSDVCDLLGETEDTTIPREELRQKLERGDLVLLDAQAPGWYEREHLPGARKMPDGDVKTRMHEIVPDRRAEIVVYCWSETCGASGIAVRALRSLGYQNVRRYAGGKRDWLEGGLPIVTDTA